MAELRDGPEQPGYGPLRVINQDRIQPATGFGTHSQRDMEIVTYVLEGAIAHRDSIGTGSTIAYGDVQRVSAGTGVQHSECNAHDGATHFLQIWIEPVVLGLPPSYEQKRFSPQEKRGRLRLIVSPDGWDGSLRVYQDAFVYAGLFDGEERAECRIGDGRLGYLHVARGSITANGHALGPGDALKSGSEDIALSGGLNAEVIVFNLPESL
jgi:redox-sensitive bicupin YhaK (pirin superfamily)